MKDNDMDDSDEPGEEDYSDSDEDLDHDEIILGMPLMSLYQFQKH